MDKTGQRGPLTRKAPGGMKAPTLSLSTLCPPLLPHHRALDSVSLILCGYFPRKSELPCLALSFYLALL